MALKKCRNPAKKDTRHGAKATCAENIERLRQALRSVRDDPEIEAISTADLPGD